MMIEVLKSKIHCARVTEANLNYMGSITIDEDLMDAANMIAGEKVAIVNNNNGERFETYIIKGERGSGKICLNGAILHNIAKADNRHLGGSLSNVNYHSSLRAKYLKPRSNGGGKGLLNETHVPRSRLVNCGLHRAALNLRAFCGHANVSVGTGEEGDKLRFLKKSRDKERGIVHIGNNALTHGL